MNKDRAIFPDTIHTEVKVVLPPEATVLLRDLHADRQAIGFGIIIMVACAIALTVKAVLGSAK